MSHTFKDLKKKVYRVLNKFLYRKKVVELIVRQELVGHIPTEEFGKVRVEYEILEGSFSGEKIQDIEDHEKGATDSDVLAFTEVNNTEGIYILFSLIFVMAFFRNMHKHFQIELKQ